MNPDNDASPFTVGQWVSVASRTSPGINQPGGIGRITAVNDDHHVSVKYVLDGRHEKSVHRQYVQEYSWETPAATNTGTHSRLRDRTMMLGRCTKCGSLRADCQSCDFATAAPPENHSAPPRRRRGAIPATSLLMPPPDGTDSDSSGGSSDSSQDRAYERMMQRHRREYVRYKRSVRRAAALNTGSEPLVVPKPSAGGRGHRHGSQKRRRMQSHRDLQNEISVLATVGMASETESNHSDEAEDHPMVDLSSHHEGSSDSDHSLDHIPLPQLLQRSVPPHHPSFIQPEGDAEQLPQDVPDLTAAVSYSQLLPLLDEILQKMEAVDIPQAKRKLLQFERAFQEAQKDPLVTRAQWHTLQQQSETMHDAMVQTIIRNGYDQCQMALRKLTSRRFFKLCAQQQQSVEPPIVFLGNQVDVRELQLDALGQAAEEILSQLRHYTSVLRRQCLDEEASVELPSPSEDGSLGSSSSYSFHQQLLASQPMLPSSPRPYTLDLHPYARRKKRRHHRHDRRRMETRRQQNTKRKKIQSLRRNQRSDANADAFSVDATLSDGARSRDSASSSSLYDTLLASQSPSQFPSSTSGQGNLEPRRRTELKRARAVHSEPRNQHGMDRDADLGTDASGNSDIDFDTTDTHLDGLDGNRIQGGIGKDKTTASLLQERSAPWMIKDHIRRRENIGSEKHQKRTRSTPASEAMFLTALPNDENQPRNNYNTWESNMSSSTSVVPDIEALLPMPPVEAEGLKRGAGRQPKKKSTADRMEKWLESNADIDPQTNQTDSNDSLYRTRNLRSHNLSAPLMRQERIPAVISPNTMRATQSRLFSVLGKDDSPGDALVEADKRSISDLKSFCRHLVNLESNDLLSKALSDICLWFENGNVVSSLDAHLAFQSLVDLLLKDDMNALQFLVSKESPNVRRFISVVVTLLRLLRCKANEKLMSNGDVLFHVFSEDRCQVFLDFVVLQLVDTLMSIFHPQAWGLCIGNSQNVLEQLKPLRNELARHFDILERACRCISRDMGPQEWRCVCGGDGIYVSAVNPDEWRSFLSGGSVPPKPVSTRLAAFDTVYPRCEVDAIWCLVGFLAGSDTYSNDGSEDNRWHFLSQLLSKGSLTVSQGPGRLPPPKDQIEAAVEDLTNLISLIASGVLGNVPRRDTILVDLIQKCVWLECDFVEANDFSWSPITPAIKREKLITKLYSCFTQPTSDAATSGNLKREAFLSFLRDLSAPEIEISWMNKPLLLPSSRLLRCCLALFLAWKSQIPSEKVKRLQCFENVIKALVKSLTSENSAAGSTSPHFQSAKRDAFLDAFNAAPNDDSISESRQLLVRTEVAAYIALFALFDFTSDGEMVTCLSQHLDVGASCELLWNIVSDDKLRQRRDWLSSRGSKCKPLEKYNGDVIRLYNAAKILSLVGIMIAGQHPFRFDAVFSSLPADEGVTAMTTKPSSPPLIFVLSTLIACLDCMCDLRYTPEAFSSIVICTLAVLTPLNHLPTISNNGSIVVPITSRNRESLRSAVHLIAASQVLQRAFNTVVCSQASGFEADMCFQSVVLAIRYVLKICPENSCVESAIPQVETFAATGNDEDFGEIDDAALANLDLCDTSEVTQTYEHDAEWMYSIYNMLADALVSSKPSSRSCIYTIPSSETEIVVSPQGMALVSTHAEMVCAILAEVAATQWYSSCPMKALWNVGNRFSFFDDQDDILYMKALGIRISRQLCRSYSSTIVRNVLRDGGESILFNLLESMIDHRLLRKIPSCNLDRIRLNGGSSAEEQGFAELFDYKNGYPKRLRNRLDETRSFCHDVSHGLFDGNEGSELSPTVSTFEQALLNFSTEVHLVELVPSLELELLDRFKLFQGLLFEARTRGTTLTSFERLSALLLTSCSYELVHLLQRIGIQDQAYADVKQESYGRSKLFETVACQSELLVSLISTTIRCHSLRNSTSSDDFMAMIGHLCDHFACPLLDGRSLNLMTVLREIVVYGSSFLNGVNPNIGRIGNLVSPNFDLKRYCELLRDSFTRRTRELVVAIAASTTSEPKWKSSKLLNSILVAGTSHGSDVTTFVAQSVCSKEFYMGGLVLKQASLSPMQRAIDKQFAQMEKDSPLDDNLSTALQTVKRFALQDFAIPKLLKHGIDARSTVLLFRFIQCILDHDRNEILQNRSGPYLQFDVLSLCSVARGIGMSVRNMLDSNVADDTHVIALYTCARSLMNLPASCLYPNSIGWLIDWSYPSPNMTSNTIHSNYLWYFSCWLRDFGKLILDVPDKTLFHALHEESKMAEAAAFWIPLGTDESSLSTSYQLMDLDRQIFPESGATREVMKLNRYKTTATVRFRESHNDVTESSSNVPLNEWEPSTDVRYAVRQFMEKIKFATPTR